jgi:hypothetical protein
MWCRQQRSRAERRDRLDFVGSPAAPKYANCTSFHKCHDDLHSPSQHLSRCLAQLASDGEEWQKPDGMLKFAKEIADRYFKKHSVPVKQTGEICHSEAPRRSS